MNQEINTTQEEHDKLVYEKKQLEDKSYQISKKLYMKEFNLALMKGVAIIGIVLLILSITLAFFIDVFVQIGVTAAIIIVIFALLAHFYNKKLKNMRDEKDQIRQEYMTCCDKLDAIDHKENRQ